jgi:hypothetical protein
MCLAALAPNSTDGRGSDGAGGCKLCDAGTYGKGLEAVPNAANVRRRCMPAACVLLSAARARAQGLPC